MARILSGRLTKLAKDEIYLAWQGGSSNVSEAVPTSMVP